MIERMILRNWHISLFSTKPIIICFHLIAKFKIFENKVHRSMVLGHTKICSAVSSSFFYSKNNILKYFYSTYLEIDHRDVQSNYFNLWQYIVYLGVQWSYALFHAHMFQYWIMSVSEINRGYDPTFYFCVNELSLNNTSLLIFDYTHHSS